MEHHSRLDLLNTPSFQSTFHHRLQNHLCHSFCVGLCVCGGDRTWVCKHSHVGSRTSLKVCACLRLSLWLQRALVTICRRWADLWGNSSCFSSVNSWNLWWCLSGDKPALARTVTGVTHSRASHSEKWQVWTFIFYLCPPDWHTGNSVMAVFQPPPILQ